MFELRDAKPAAVARHVTALSSAQATQTQSALSFQENGTDQRNYTVCVCLGKGWREQACLIMCVSSRERQRKWEDERSRERERESV